jgi:hypothetical protein
MHKISQNCGSVTTAYSFRLSDRAGSSRFYRCRCNRQYPGASEHCSLPNQPGAAGSVRRSLINTSPFSIKEFYSRNQRNGSFPCLSVIIASFSIKIVADCRKKEIGLGEGKCSLIVETISTWNGHQQNTTISFPVLSMSPEWSSII